MPRLRMRSEYRSGRRPGQPVLVPTDPKRVPKTPKRVLRYKHTCAECFGPRAAFGRRPFCHRCLDDLFGWPGDQRYDRFIITEKARQTRLRNRSTTPPPSSR